MSQTYPRLNDARERTADSLISAIRTANARGGTPGKEDLWAKVSLLAQAYCSTMQSSAEQHKFSEWYNAANWTPESAERYVEKLERERRKTARVAHIAASLPAVGSKWKAKDSEHVIRITSVRNEGGEGFIHYVVERPHTSHPNGNSTLKNFPAYWEALQ